MGVVKIFNWYLRNISKLFQGIFQKFSRVFIKRYRGVPKDLEGSFRGI